MIIDNIPLPPRSAPLVVAATTDAGDGALLLVKVVLGSGHVLSNLFELLGGGGSVEQTGVVSMLLGGYFSVLRSISRRAEVLALLLNLPQ